LVHFFKGPWRGRIRIAGETCSRIGSRLAPEEDDAWELKALARSINSFEGVNNSKGLAFVVSPDNKWFDLLKDEQDSLLRPYVTGDDILSSALKRIDRWALDILDLELDEIRTKWPVAYKFLMDVVAPTRTPSELKSYKGLIDRWWQFWNHRADQMERLRRQNSFIAFPKVTKYPNCMRAPTSWIYTNQVVLIENEREDYLAIFKSSAFRSWLQYLSGGKIEGRLRLSISESIAKYPLPNHAVSSHGMAAAERLDSLSVEFAERHGFGLTEVMNWINTPNQDDATLSEMRSLMATIDNEVFTAYEWTDLRPEYDFRPFSGGSVNDPWRWALDDQTLSEVIRRLTDLNRIQYQAELAAGLHGKTTSKRGNRSGTSAARAPSLFREDQ